MKPSIELNSQKFTPREKKTKQKTANFRDSKRQVMGGLLLWREFVSMQ